MVLVICVFGLYGIGRFLLADHAAIKSTTRSSASSALHEAERAVELSPWVGQYREIVAEIRLDQYLQDRAVYGTSDSAGDRAGALQESFNRALLSINDAIDYSPREMDNYSNLATLYLRASSIDPKQLDKAVESANRGLAVAPNSASLMMIAASAHAEKGDVEKAIELAKQASELDPRYVNPLLLLGSLYRSRGEGAAAREAYERVLALQPDNQEALGALQNVPTTSTAK
jgi:tetratricopeptide (TPR) repeat protein